MLGRFNVQQVYKVINGYRWNCKRGIHFTQKRSSVILQHIQKHDFSSTSLDQSYRKATTRALSSTTGTHSPKPIAVYTPPQTGLISRLPSSWIPYAELMRLDKPTGTYYLFFPCLFSTLMAAPMATPMATVWEVTTTGGLFFLGALIMRGAGCTINDLWDRNLDPHVERTRFRPIARKAVSPPQAIGFLGFQMLAGLGVLLSFPAQCFWYATPSLILVTLYPLAKRVTNYPQVVLGLTFSWGAIMGFPALGVDLLTNMEAAISAALLYASCVVWTVNYDMIYAHMDIKDDAKVGIKSIARAHEHNTKTVLSGLAGAQVVLLLAAGYMAGAGQVFTIISCGGTAIALDAIIRHVKLEDPKDCWRWFRNGAWITGGVISVGLAGDYLYRRREEEVKSALRTLA